jgi:hypothetical protein
MVHRRKEECGRNRNCEEAEIDREAWLLNEPHEEQEELLYVISIL